METKRRGRKPTGVNYPIILNVRVTQGHGIAFDQLLEKLGLARFAPYSKSPAASHSWARGELARTLLQAGIERAAQEPGFEALRETLKCRLGVLFEPAPLDAPRELAGAKQGELTLRARRKRVMVAKVVTPPEPSPL
jgi:hypothetical protein